MAGALMAHCCRRLRPTDPVGAAAVGLRRSHVTHPVVVEFDAMAVRSDLGSPAVELGDNTAPNTERVQRNLVDHRTR